MGRDPLLQIGMMRTADSVLTLRDLTVDFVRGFGFPHIFFISPIVMDPRDGRVLVNVGFSMVWERAYRRWLYQIDPMPGLALSTSMPFRWRELAERDDVDARGKRYLSIIARHGMADGLGIPTFGPGPRCGLLGMGGAMPLPELDPVDIDVLQHGVQTSYLRYCELVNALVELGPPLSNREMDVLYWVIRGKSNSIIAQLLGISAPSVDTYLRRIFAKLNVADRTAAAVVAVQRGFFVTGGYRWISE